MGVIDYTDSFGSKIKNLIPMKLNRVFKDVTNDIAAKINHVSELHSQKKYGEAAEYISANGLDEYIISAKDMNFIDEETRNLEILCLSKRQSVFYLEDEPLFITVVGDVWIGG